MMFTNSLKLFGSNWGKMLKFFLFYLIVWAICFALFVPVILEFAEIIKSVFQAPAVTASYVGVFQGLLGNNLTTLLNGVLDGCILAVEANLGMAIYGLIVLFVILPFLINLGKYALIEMLYSYMTSKTKVGFFSAFVKSLKKSLSFAVCKTLYNVVFLAATLAILYGLSLVTDLTFIKFGLPLVIFVFLVLFYTLNQISVLGWAPAMIVFDCNVFSAYRKGFKAVKRHFWSIFGTTALYFAILWGCSLIFGVYALTILVPLMTALLCIYNMVVFFTSQGMRFYVNDNKILTPKKLEEVDNINKTAYIL